MNIQKATQKYESWLGKRITLLKADLDLKHQSMTENLFSFLRATFYRWAQVWPEACPDLAKAPAVLAVGDLHVENFGTWRDIEGRLIWGVNDFDETYPMAYTIDLVRLGTSAELAIAASHLLMSPRSACKQILAGYTEGLDAGGRAFVLAEHHEALRAIATGRLRDPVRYWEKLNALSTLRKAPPASAVKALERLLPERDLEYRVAHRVAGLGSLGRQRFLAIADWRGGKVVREAKELVASACLWAAGGKGRERIFYQQILDAAVRCPDPFVHLCGRWIVRRLAPDCSRIELSSLPGDRDEARLLYAMGWETANIHLGSPRSVKAVRRDLRNRPPGWLYAGVKRMRKAVTGDWNEWRAKQ
jgi:uncharacterized protein (DUF2252 family)